MKFRNVSGDDLVVNVLGGIWVEDGELTPELTAAQAKGISSQDIWEPQTEKTPSKQQEN